MREEMLYVLVVRTVEVQVPSVLNHVGSYLEEICSLSTMDVNVNCVDKMWMSAIK